MWITAGVFAVVGVLGLIGAAGDTTIPGWMPIPSTMVGFGVPLGLVLKKTLMLRSDHEESIKALQKSYDERIEGILSRLDDAVSGREAWRIAQSAEVEARVAAERTSAALIDQAKTSALNVELNTKLVDALMAATVGGKGQAA